MTRLSFVILLVFGSFAVLQAQNDRTLLRERKKTIVYKIKPDNEVLFGGLSYTGIILLHPGIRAFVDYPYVSKEKLTVRKRWLRKDTLRTATIKTHQLRPIVGFYHHMQNHNGAYLGTEWSNIRHTNGSFSNDWGVGISYLRTFLNGRVYEQNTDGSFDQLSILTGYNHFRLNVYVSMLNIQKKNFRLSVKVNQWVLIPHNTTIAYQTSLDFDFSYRFIKNPIQ